MVDADEVVGDQAEHAVARAPQVVVDDDVVLGGDRELPGVARGAGAAHDHVAAAGGGRGRRRRERRVAGRAGAVGDVDDAVRGERDRRRGAPVRGHGHARAAEADPRLTGELVARLRQVGELSVGRRRGQHGRVGDERADEARGAGAAAGGDRRGVVPAARRCADLDHISRGAAEDRRAVADQERVVGVQGAVDAVSPDEVDPVAELPARAGDRGAVAALLDRLRALDVGAGDRRGIAVGDRVGGLELGEVEVVEEAGALEGGDDRLLGVAA